MEENKVHNIDFLNNTLPDKCANLIIADPPYFEVKGEFDFAWKSFDDYLQDVEKWAIECKRLLADNGTLFWYGHAKKIAYSQVIFDKHFNLINNLVWDKGSFMGLEESKGLRSFAPCTERILMYEHKKQFEFICDDIRNYLIEEKEKSKLTLTDLNEILIGKRKSDLIAKRYFGTSQWELPTKEMYLKLQTTGFFKREFEDLRREFEDLRRPFTNDLKLQEILRFKDEYWGKISPFSKILSDHIKNKGFTQKQISELQLSKNGKLTGWVSNKIKFGELPTTEQWSLICKLFKIDNKYEELRKEYEELRRPFTNDLKLQEILRFSNEAVKIGAKYDHDTVKPETLTRALILTCSRPNDLVVVPFAGSGTECAMSVKEGRRTIGFEITEKHTEMSNKRIQKEFSTPQLFSS